MDEVLAKAQLSKDIDVAGIDRVMDTFQSRNLDWTPYFDKADTLDIFFAYGRTWRNTHLEDLKLLAGKKGARIRIVLPDPDDEHTMRDLTRRFNYTEKELESLPLGPAVVR